MIRESGLRNARKTRCPFAAACRLLALGALLSCSLSYAQEVTGTLGSPSATTTINGKRLPAPDPKFGGVIKDDALSSTPWWAPRIVPPEQAPNILLIMTDDAGFGVPSTFGGVIPTPTMDRIASEGLRYNRVFSTALCSPTRAALITGRNHHSAGFGVISEQSTGFPGYNSVINEDKATIGRMLLDNGYSTSWFGKDHNTPAFAASQVGPFDQWPTGMGFEYFYGFVGGDANQWEPNLFRNTTQIYPFEGKPVFLWNLVDLERFRWEGPDVLAPGKHTIEFDFDYEGLGVGTLALNNMSGVGRPGTGTLKVDGKPVVAQKMPKTLPMILQWDESFDIGSDTLTGVYDVDYQPPFTFTGELNKLTINVDRPQLSPADIKKLQTATRNNKSSE